MITNILQGIFLFSFIIQILFFASKLLKFATYKKKSREDVDKPPVSIIVCAKNEIENLKILLPKLYQQQYPEFEIIVVNDRSGDGTYEFLLEQENENNLLQVVNVDQTPDHINAKKFALTLGIKKARYEILLLTDADGYPVTDEWVSEMSGAFEDKTNIVLGYSQYEKKTGLLNFFIRYETLYTGIQYLSAAMAKRPYMGVGRNLAYRKSFFLENKGFAGFENVTGGDDDLFVNKYATRSNTKIAVGNKALVRSYPKRSVKAYFRQKLRHLSVGKHYKMKNKTGIAILTLSHILFWFSFITLVIMERETLWLLSGLLIRSLFLLITFISASKKLGDRINPFMIPLMDILYITYYFLMGIPALLSKKVKWS